MSDDQQPKKRKPGRPKKMAAPAAPAVKVVPLESLVRSENNVRLHPEESKKAIAASLGRFGAARSIVVDGQDQVAAGNGTIEAALAAGLESAIVVETSGRELVVVKRPDWTPQEAMAYAIADNRTNEFSLFDEQRLFGQLKELKFDESLVLGAGFKVNDVDGYFRKQAEIVEDEPPEPPQHPVSMPGDLWILGEHRLLCGDSTKAEDVARVLNGCTPFIMVTDPPYGVNYDPEWRLEADLNKEWQTRAEGKVENDDKADWTESYKLFPGHVAYVWHAGRFAADLVVNLRDAKFEIRTQIIWSKPNLVISRGHYHWQHEPCWYAVRPGGSAKWCGDRKQSTIWQIANMHRTQGCVDDGKTDHGTQKPVECMARPIRNHGDKGDHVYEPFSGSGTTIIAAEQLGRRCFAIEIAPQYVDVAVQRWENLTGKEAILEETGQTFAEVKQETE